MALVVKNPPANAGDVRDVGSIPGWGRSPGGGHGNLLQHSCLENPMDKGAWRGHRVGHDRGNLVHNRIKKQCEFLQSSKCFLCKEVRGLFG